MHDASLDLQGPIVTLGQDTPCDPHGWEGHLDHVSMSVSAGELLPMFKACMPVMRSDMQSARFLMPYLLHNVISTGSPDSRTGTFGTHAAHYCKNLARTIQKLKQ